MSVQLNPLIQAEYKERNWKGCVLGESFDSPEGSSLFQVDNSKIHILYLICYLLWFLAL